MASTLNALGIVAALEGEVSSPPQKVEEARERLLSRVVHVDYYMLVSV